MLAVADTCIAAQNAVVAAESLGIGSCYIGDVLENAEAMRDALHLPQYVVPACMLVFGRPTEQQQRRPKPARFAEQAVVCENVHWTARPTSCAPTLRRKPPPTASSTTTLTKPCRHFASASTRATFPGDDEKRRDLLERVL